MSEIPVGLNVFSVSAMFNFLSAVGLGLFIYLRAPNDPRHITYGYMTLAAAMWSFFYVAWQFSASEEWALVFLRLLMAGAIFLPVTWLHHMLCVTKLVDSWRWFLRLNYGVGVFFLFLDFTPVFIAGVRPIAGFMFWGIAGWGFTLCLAWWTVLVWLVLWIHVKSYGESQGQQRRGFIYLFVGCFIGYMGGATNFPLWYGIEFLPYGNVGFSVYISCAAYTLLRFHYLGFGIYIERGPSYFVALLLISLPLYPLLLLSQFFILGEIHLVLSLTQLAFYLLMVAGACVVKMDSRGAVVRTLVKGREYRMQLLNRFFSHVLKINDTTMLGQAIVETMSKSMGVSKAVLFVLQVEQSQFRATASVGCNTDEDLLTKGWSILDELPQLMMYTHRRIGVPELQAVVDEEWEPKVGQELEALGLAWCYPLFVNDRLAGFLAFGSAASETVPGLGGEVIWKGMIHEAMMALENALLRDEVRRSEMLLCQVDRLRSLRVMVHTLGEELQNPVTMVKTFVQLSGLRRDDEKFFRRLEQLVKNDFLRMEDLTKELREYLQPLARNVPTEVRVNDLLDMCLWFLSTNPSYRHVMIRKQLVEGLPVLVLERQKLLQGLFNGLLFLLHSQRGETETLLLKTYTCDENDYLQVVIQMGWESALQGGTAVTGAVILEELEMSCPDATLAEGVLVGVRLLQGLGGSWHTLVVDDVIVGFELQISDRASRVRSGEEVSVKQIQGVSVSLQ